MQILPRYPRFHRRRARVPLSQHSMPLTQFQCCPLLGDRPLQYQKVLSDGKQRVSFVSVSVKLIP